MEIPAKVSVFNSTLETKGKQGSLVAVNNGYYEVFMEFKESYHRVLFPIADTVLIFNDPLPAPSIDFELER